ncbi:MAG: hypothetical protein RRY38_04395, partial [Oscillospiraceae bacterium]
LSDGSEIAQRSKVVRERLGAQTSENHLRTIAFKAVRIFFNTIDRAVDVMKQAGVEASSERQDVNGCVEYRIRIPAADACTPQ